VKAVDGAVLWANMHLLFWLSTIPFATAWMERTTRPIHGIYGAALLMSAIAWYILQTAIIRQQGSGSPLPGPIGR